MPGTAQHRTVREPDHDRSPSEEDQPGRAGHGPRRSVTAGSHAEQQLRLESDMGELIGDQGTAENLQALAVRGGFQRAVIDGSNKLGADENAEIQLQPREPSQATKSPIGPVGGLQRQPVILHEGPQQRRMTPLLSNQQVDDSDQMRHVVRARETFCGSQKRAPTRLFPELKRRDGTRDELCFVGAQHIAQTVRYSAGTQGVMFEVVQPDLELTGTHVATLLIALTLSVRAHSGIPLREFGQIVAAARAGPALFGGATPGQIQTHGQAAIFAIGELNSAHMRLGDLSSQRKADAGTAALGRVERQQRLCQHGLAHAGAAVPNLDALIGAVAHDQKLDRIGRVARLVRILQ